MTEPKTAERGDWNAGADVRGAQLGPEKGQELHTHGYLGDSQVR
jgi:hypothetical protein